MLVTSLVALAPFLSFVAASVTIYSHVPAGATELAFDHDQSMIVAYNKTGGVIGHLLPSAIKKPTGKRDLSSCAQLTSTDVQRLPGWPLLQAYAQNRWGNDYKVLANPSEFPLYGAQACIEGDLPIVTLTSQPTCQTHTQTINGQLNGTNGTVALSFTQGTTSQTSTTVTQQASIALGISFSVKVGVPSVAEETTTLTSTMTFTNTLSSSNTFTSSNTETQTVTMQQPAGEKCNLSVQVLSCYAQGRVQQRMVSHGWVWFYYKHRHEGHYDWALNMDAIISDANQRSSIVAFNTATSSDTHANYQAQCA